MRPVVPAAMTAVALLALGAGAGPAAADAPSEQGWWNLANQGVQPPDPPDVPADGLLVQGGPSGPTAVAALRFQVDPSASVTGLTLAAAGSVPPQAAGVLACPTTAAWTGAQDAAWAKLPAYDCTHSVIGVLVGTNLVFTGIGRLVKDSGELAFALVPGQTDRVALAKPAAGALAVSPGAPANPGPAYVPPPPAPSAAPSPAPSSGTLALPPVTPPVAPPPAVPVPQAAPPVVAAPVAAVAAPRALPVAKQDDTRARVVVALEALLVLATFGLLGAGPARRLVRLTGEPATDADRPRGVGRFTSQRSGSAPRL